MLRIRLFIMFPVVNISFSEKLALWEKKKKNLHPQHTPDRCGLGLRNLSLHTTLLMQPSPHPITNIIWLETYGLSIQACNIPAEPMYHPITHLCSILCVVFFSLSNHSNKCDTRTEGCPLGTKTTPCDQLEIPFTDTLCVICAR